jgi:hypothetical protein
VALLAGCGGGAAETAPTTVTEQVTVTEKVTETTSSGEAAATCSASGLSAALPEQDLPAAVADVRQRIAEAAVACDYDALQAIALEQDGFTFSYGAETSAADHWAGLEESGEDPMRTLVEILRTPVTRNEAGAYAWPTAYTESPDRRGVGFAGGHLLGRGDRVVQGGRLLSRLPRRDHARGRLAVLRRGGLSSVRPAR